MSVYVFAVILLVQLVRTYRSNVFVVSTLSLHDSTTTTVAAYREARAIDSNVSRRATFVDELHADA